MPLPTVWVVEDMADRARLTCELVNRVSARVACRVVASFDAASALIAAPSTEIPVMIVLDLLMPRGTGPVSTEPPGVVLLRSLRSSMRFNLSPIIVRSGVPEAVPPALIGNGVYVLDVSDGPGVFMDTVASVLAGAGVRSEGALVVDREGAVVSQQSVGLSALTLIGVFGVGSSIWVASVLQVTSESNAAGNALLVALGGIGGVLIGAGRLKRGAVRVLLIVAGATVCVGAALVLAPWSPL